MALKIRAHKTAYHSNLVSGQTASVKIVPAPADNEVLHQHMDNSVDAVLGHLIDYCNHNYLDIEEFLDKQIKHHPFKRKAGQKLYIGKQFKHTDNAVKREAMGVGKIYTHRKLISDTSDKCFNKLNKYELEHFTDAMIKRWNRYMTYLNQLLLGRDALDTTYGRITGLCDDYKVQITEIKDDNTAQLMGVNTTQL